MESDSSLLVIIVLGGLVLGLFIGIILYASIESSKDEPSDGFWIFLISILGTLGLAVLAYFIWEAIKKAKAKKENLGYTGYSGVSFKKKDPLEDYDRVTETTKRTELVPTENDRVINEINYVTVNHNFFPKTPV